MHQLIVFLVRLLRMSIEGSFLSIQLIPEKDIWYSVHKILQKKKIVDSLTHTQMALLFSLDQMFLQIIFRNHESASTFSID